MIGISPLMGIILALLFGLPQNAMAHNEFVTAVRNSESNLQVILWGAESEGDIVKRLHSVTAGQVSQISLTFIGTYRFATAVRNSTGNLQVITWSISRPELRLKRLSSEATRIGITSVSATMGNGYLITVVRNNTGDLKVITWEVGFDGNITLRGQASAGRATSIQATYVNQHLVTVMRNSRGDLQIITWEISDDGSVIRRGSALAGNVSNTVTATTLPSSDLLVTALNNSSENLQLIIWKVDNNGDIERLGSASADAVGVARGSNLISVNSQYSHYHFTTTFKNRDGKLQILFWRYYPGGLQIEQIGSVLGDSVVGVYSATLYARSILVTSSVKQEGNSLQIDLWGFKNDGSIIHKGKAAAGEVIFHCPVLTFS